PDEVLRELVDEEDIAAFRARALTPDRPMLRGTAQNPDVYFQGREAGNGHYLALPSIVQRLMDRFATLTGRAYRLFEYYGDPEAENVIVSMCSSIDTIRETVDWMNAHGAKV